jgi:hypothetical protein
MTTTHSVTDTIIEQLGGARFAAMTGATFAVSETDQYVNVKFKGSAKANWMQVKLQADDTYTVTFMTARGLNIKGGATYDMVYASDLQRLFTNVTGLYTRL